MSKFRLWVIGWWSCLSWMIPELVHEYFPDLKFWNIPTHIGDFIWYAERVNGRLAMLAVVAILALDLFTHKSIWELIGVH
jgi:hypothetical protein